MGREPEYRIYHRPDRADYYASIPTRSGRCRIHGRSREEVLERLQAKLKQIREQPETPVGLSPETTLREYVQYFLEASRDRLESRTIRSYEQLLKAHVLPYRVEGRSLGALRLTQIRRRHLKALILAKRKAGYARDTVRLIRAAISTVLTEAVDDELILANPALRLMAKSGGKEERKRKSEAPEKVKAMDGQTLEAFLMAARSSSEPARPKGGHGWRSGTHSPIFSALFVTLAKTGLRPSEAIALTPFDLKPVQKLIRVSKAVNDDREPRGWTKTGLNRSVEITEELVAELQAHITLVRAYFEGRRLSLPPMLFPSTQGTYLDVRNLRRMFSAICSQAGIEGFALYDLRHTYASLMLMRGADPRWVQRQLGHESLTTTLRYYAHWIPGEANESYALLIEQRPKLPAESPVNEIKLADSASRLCLQRRGERDGEVAKSFGINWWAQQDSNLRPADYESAALTD